MADKHHGHLAKVAFKLEKDTPGTLRFQEVDEKGNPQTNGAVIGTLYIRKAFLNGRKPEMVTVDLDQIIP